MSSGGTDDPGSKLEDGLMASPMNRTKAPGTEGGQEGADDFVTDAEWRVMFRDGLKASSEYYDNKLRANWNRNYRAFGNRHMSGSKYDTARYRHRSKLFKPKTRMAVRKNDSTAASAMFSTADVVSVTAEESSDRIQLLTAKFVNAALNYRLDRGTKMTGPRWFLTAIGARQDAQIAGVCCSKQYWEFEEIEFDVRVTKPKIDAFTGIQAIDPATGQGAMEETIERDRKIIRDRLMITNIPPEQAFVDPSADWRDPIQEGGYFIAGFPMRINDAQHMIDAGASRSKMGGAKWRDDIDVKKIVSARSEQAKRNEATRRAREDGQDRYDSRHAGKQADVVWLYECFYRYDGEDWTFWMLGERIMLTDPVPTRDAYPEQDGDRPYTWGLGALETHKVHPMAPVESWQPLQQEMNDVTNLTLDAQKMAISPITKIKRGRNIDWKQIQNRGPDAAVAVEDKDDVTFEKAPGPGGEQQMQMNNLNVDFDELAGVFSTGSVQTNRQLNETVGGMQLMQGSSNALTEFDLRVWVETWVEPTLRQCVKLIQHYESSAHVIALAGKTAGLIVLPDQEPPPPGPLSPDQPGQPQPGQQPGAPPEPPLPIEQVLANLDTAVISVKVNVGIGAVDNKQKAEKFVSGMKVTMEAGPLLAAQGVIPNGTEMMNEFWGLIGYKDADRFFMPKPKDDSPPPEVQKIMAEMRLIEQKGQIDAMQAKLDAALKQQEATQKQQEADAKIMTMREQMQIEREKAAAELQAERERAATELQIEREKAGQAMQIDAAKGQQQLAQGAQQHQQKIEQQRQVGAVAVQQSAIAGDVKLRQGEEAHKAKLKQTAAMARVKPKPAKANGKGK